MAAKRGMRGWGRLRQLPSQRWQSAYIGPDGVLHTAPSTFATKLEAEGWLAAERRRIDLGTWSPPGAAPTPAPVPTLRTYAERWWAETAGRHKPRTRALYRGYLANVILPDLGGTCLDALTVPMIRSWFAGLEDFPTRNANAYSLLRTILYQAVGDELVPANPCRVKKAAVKHRVTEPVALTAAEIRALAERMEPQWRVLVLLAGFSGLRWGELTALRRSDFDLTEGECTVTVHRAVVRVGGQFVIGRPKTPAALRTVPLPSALRPVLEAQLEAFSAPGPDALVFPARAGGVLNRGTLRDQLTTAAEAIGHSTLRFHDLRHSAATLLAQAGATLADHMQLMGHTSSAMSARYTHTTAARNRELVEGLWDRI